MLDLESRQVQFSTCLQTFRIFFETRQTSKISEFSTTIEKFCGNFLDLINESRKCWRYLVPVRVAFIVQFQPLGVADQNNE